MQQLGVKSMLAQQAQLSQTQLQLASGKKILTPSDDPGASAKVLGLNEVIAQTGQYSENITVARSRLELEEGSLAEVNESLFRIRELAVQGANATQTPETRLGIAEEVRLILEGLVATGNKRDANGEFIFSGFQSKTTAFARDGQGGFTYNGDQGQRFLQISPSRQVAVGDSGDEVFMAIKNGNGNFAVSDDVTNLGSGVIDPGSITNPTQYVADTYDIVMAGAATTATADGVIGAPVDNAPTVNDLRYRLQINGFDVIEDSVAYADVNQLRDAINNSTLNPPSVTGVTAYVIPDANGIDQLHLVNNAPSNAPITVTESMVDVTAVPGPQPIDTADTLTGYFGTQLVGDDASTTITGQTITLPSSVATEYLVLDSLGNVVTSGQYEDGGQIAFNGMQTYITGEPTAADRFAIEPSQNQDLFSTVQNLVDALSGSNGVGAEFSNAINRVLIDLNQSEVNIDVIRARIGGRLNAIDNQDNVNQDYVVQMRETLSGLQDLDYAEASGRMQMQLVGLQAAQQSFIKIQGLSLFNYL